MGSGIGGYVNLLLVKVLEYCNAVFWFVISVSWYLLNAL